jgi:hypothetical protein
MSLSGINFNAAELIQYLIHQRSFGQSLNTCQRCAFEVEEVTSVLVIQSLSSLFSQTKLSSIGREKLGHHVQLSNLSVEEKSGVQSITST